MVAPIMNSWFTEFDPCIKVNIPNLLTFIPCFSRSFAVSITLPPAYHVAFQRGNLQREYYLVDTNFCGYLGDFMCYVMNPNYQGFMNSKQHWKASVFICWKWFICCKWFTTLVFIFMYVSIFRVSTCFAILSAAILITSTMLALVGHCVRGDKMLIASGLYAIGGKYYLSQVHNQNMSTTP